jgi:UDP-N-acetylmuramate--alanine ligase
MLVVGPDERARTCAEDAPCPVRLVGDVPGAFARVGRTPGRPGFELLLPGGIREPVPLALPGQHNATNAACALALAEWCGVPIALAAARLEGFRGVGRRMEPRGSAGGVEVVDDYAHHPAEIRAVVRALKHCYPERRLVVVFQPHQASRTRCLLKHFATALAEAHEVWMPPIYFARDSEEERRRVTSEDLAAHARNEGGSVTTLPDLEAVVEHAVAHVRPGDVVVTMGAGDVDEVARGLARRLR